MMARIEWVLAREAGVGDEQRKAWVVTLKWFFDFSERYGSAGNAKRQAMRNRHLSILPPGIRVS